MKATKNLLILAMPLLMAGCGGGSSGTAPASGGVDAAGFYLGTVTTNGDSILGIVSADGAADFLEFTGTYANLSSSTQFVVLAPTGGISADSSGNYSVPYLGYSGNGYSLQSPSGGTNETGAFSGAAVAATSLIGSYSVTGSIPAGAAVKPDVDATLVYNMTYQPLAYVAPASSAIAAGTYTTTIIVGTSLLSGGTFTISADQGSAASASLSGIDGNTSCVYAGLVDIPDQNSNAYEFSISSSGNGCPLVLDNLSGVGSLLSINSATTMLVILSDKATQQGVLMFMAKTS